MAWSVAWVAVGLLFSLFVMAALGRERGHEYLAAYLIEKSLSVDNLFVFLVIFRSLRIPPDRQRLVLSWGIMGALMLRLAFVLAGVAALDRYHWLVYVFAGLLLGAAYRLWREDPAAQGESRLVAFLTRHLPVTTELRGNAFLVRASGRLVATPLLVAVCAVELTDIAFAVDSVPAALAVSTSTFVIFSSNAFAILGLRSLFVVLEHSLNDLRYLRFGLVAVLVFAAAKLALSAWLQLSPLVSVGVIVTVLAASIVPSVIVRRRERLHPFRRVRQT